jgi:hypothetical protein
MEAAFANWIVNMTIIHCQWARDQAVSLLKIASYDLRIMWCDVKIFWYS